MKYIINYRLFNEALLPSQFRKYVKEFNKERYEEKFQKFKKKYDGDRNAYRLYLPYEAELEKSETEKEIEQLLSEHNYEIIDYISGTAKFIGAKNPSKIGKVLNSLVSKVDNKSKVESLMKKFIEDPIRKSGKEEMLVCISRHPYDIAGADTDREWTNCMTIGTSNSNRVKELLSELNELDPISDKIKISEIKTKLNNIKRDGENVKYLIHDVKEGSLIAYLIKSTDKNINNPIANLNIKPYINLNNENDFILVSDDTMYGRGNEKFKKVVDDFLNEFNDNKKGMYCLNDNVYSDSNNDYFLNMDIMEFIKNTDKFTIPVIKLIDSKLDIDKIIKSNSKEKKFILKILNNIDYSTIYDDDFDFDFDFVLKLYNLLYEIGNYDGVIRMIEEIKDDIYDDYELTIKLIDDILYKNNKDAFKIIKTLMELGVVNISELVAELNYDLIIKLIKILDLKFELEKDSDYDYDDYYIHFDGNDILGKVEVEIDRDLYKKLLRNKNRIK